MHKECFNNEGGLVFVCTANVHYTVTKLTVNSSICITLLPYYTGNLSILDNIEPVTNLTASSVNVNILTDIWHADDKFVSINNDKVLSVLAFPLKQSFGDDYYRSFIPKHREYPRKLKLS